MRQCIHTMTHRHHHTVGYLNCTKAANLVDPARAYDCLTGWEARFSPLVTVKNPELKQRHTAATFVCGSDCMSQSRLAASIPDTFLMVTMKNATYLLGSTIHPVTIRSLGRRTLI